MAGLTPYTRVLVASRLGQLIGAPILRHALALQFASHASGQIAKAKATAMEIVTIRKELPAYHAARQLVAFQTVGATYEHQQAAEAWLRHADADVLRIEDEQALPNLIEQKLQEIYA